MSDEPDVTAAGNEERRRGADRRDEPQYITRKEFERRASGLRFRMMVALLLVAFAAAVAAWLGYKAGQDSQNGLVRAGREATTRNCISGGDARIATAKGFDDLRRLAIGLQTGERPRGDDLKFIVATQPAIDRLLTQAAGKRYRAPLPPGTVSRRVVEQVQALSVLRCQRRVGSSFNAVPSG